MMFQVMRKVLPIVKPVRSKDLERWKAEWTDIESIIEKDYPGILDLKADKGKIAELLASGQSACQIAYSIKND